MERSYVGVLHNFHFQSHQHHINRRSSKLSDAVEPNQSKMMKNFAFLLLCFGLPTAIAFSSRATCHLNQPVARQVERTSLKYGIVEPPPDDDCEVDGDCEESVFDRKKREKKEADGIFRQKYATDHGLQLTEVDMMETIDQYSNPTGGNLIPGVSLSALMEDD